MKTERDRVHYFCVFKSIANNAYKFRTSHLRLIRFFDRYLSAHRKPRRYVCSARNSAPLTGPRFVFSRDISTSGIPLRMQIRGHYFARRETHYKYHISDGKIKDTLTRARQCATLRVSFPTMAWSAPRYFPPIRSSIYVYTDNIYTCTHFVCIFSTLGNGGLSLNDRLAMTRNNHTYIQMNKCAYIFTESQITRSTLRESIFHLDAYP